MANAAQLIARRLYDAGCRHAYGIPGGEVLALIKGLEDAGVAFTLTKHENSAGFMAEGTYHASGAPGVLVATLGPGVANAVNVVANAHQDRVPLIFLCGRIDPAESHSFTHQIFDHRALMEPVTKATFTVVDGAVDVIVDKAVAIALDDPPGPVLLDVPISVAVAEQNEGGTVRRSRPRRGAPTGTELETARSWLGQAERPLIIAGVEALSHGAEQAVAGFVEQYGVPLITSYKAKGIVPEDHEFCLGGAGLSPRADELLLSMVADSDLVILAGYDPIEMRAGWRDPWPSDRRVVELSAVPNTHYVHQASISFLCDVGDGLRSLAARLGAGSGSKPHWADGQVAELKQQLAAAFPRDQEWGAAAVIDVARRVMPRDTVASVDTGAHRILLSQMWQCYQPRTLLQSTGLCTMGCALPLAMGYRQRARNASPVIAFVGDAGLEMVLGELATLRDLRLPLIVVVFVDTSLALIELKQRGMGYDNLGVDFGATDFPAHARAFGMHGVWADDRRSLEDELLAAQQRDGGSVIACRVGARPYDGRI